MDNRALASGIAVITLVVAFWLWSAPVTQAQAISQSHPEQVKGTRVSMTKPVGFTEAGNFSGFLDRVTGASIMVMEIPGPFQSVTAGYTAPLMKAKGMNLISRTDTKVGSYPGIFVEATQKVYGDTYHKWALSFGDKSMTVMVTANCPESKWASLSGPLKASIATARLETQTKPRDLRADLTYALPDSAELKLAERMQNTLLFTVEGKFGTEAAKKGALFVVGQSVSEAPVNDPAEYSRQRLRKTEQVKDVKIESDEAVTVSGLPGREIVAIALDSKLGTPMFLYQTMLFGDRTYYILQGHVDLTQRQTFEPVFKKMTQTFQQK